LLPSEIINELPFKNTHKALKKANKEMLKEYLCGFVATIAEKTFEYNWPESVED